MSPAVAAYGDRALLIHVEEDDALGLAAAIRAARLSGVDDVVPGAASVLVRCSTPAVVSDVRAGLAGVRPDPRIDDAGAVVAIDVVYDGADLDTVAAQTGLDVDDVVAAHTAATYRAAFVGFRPGFAYLTGLDPRLHVPRRATPRTEVPAGAVAIADRYSGIYPSASPGGWHLLGRTDVVLWDLTRESPALLEPGTVVRFVAR